MDLVDARQAFKDAVRERWSATGVELYKACMDIEELATPLVAVLHAIEALPNITRRDTVTVDDMTNYFLDALDMTLTVEALDLLRAKAHQLLES